MANLSKLSSEMTSPFIHNEPVIPPFFAGRKQEISYIADSLFSKKESIIIYGNDAIGKSSIIATIYKNQIENCQNKSLWTESP